MDHEPFPKQPYLGRGWHVELERTRRSIATEMQWVELDEKRLIRSIDTTQVGKKGRGEIVSFPELVICAPDFNAAQHALQLIIATTSICQTALYLPEDHVAVPVDRKECEWYESRQMLLPRAGIQTSGLAAAARLAARASLTRRHQYAIWKAFSSFRLVPISFSSTHPSYGDWFGVEKAPRLHAEFGAAISLAYSSIEELGLELRSLNDKPTRKNGDWDPVAKADVEARLSSAGIPLEKDVTWLVRNSPTRIERASPPPKGKRASWVRRGVRDRHTSLLEALAQARWMRSRAGAHGSSTLSKSLTAYDVLNVQGLARYLIMCSLRSGR